jgi:hypothetical protein
MFLDIGAMQTKEPFLKKCLNQCFPILIYIVENVYCICDIPSQNNLMNIKYLLTCLRFVTNVFHGLKNIVKQ